MARAKTHTEIIARDAVLIAVDAIVRHQLGAHWKPGAHMALKAAYLEIIDTAAAADLRNRVYACDCPNCVDNAGECIAHLCAICLTNDSAGPAWGNLCRDCGASYEETNS
jgi:hypothetical protein